MAFWDEGCCQSANHQSKRCKDLGDPLRSPFRFLVRVTLVEFLVDAVIDLFDNPRIIWLKTMAHIHCRFSAVVTDREYLQSLISLLTTFA